MLNGCRSLVFCRTDQWLPKRRAAEAVADSEAAFRPLVEAALHSFERPRGAALPLPAADVRRFLGHVATRVGETTQATEAVWAAGQRRHLDDGRRGCL